MNPNEGQPGQGYPGGQGYSGYPGSQGYPPPPVGTYGPPTGAGGFNFQDLYQRWRAVVSIGYDPQRGIGLDPQRGISTFDAQQPAANWTTLLISLVGLGVVQMITGMLGAVFYHHGNGVGGNVFNIISVPLGFLIGAGILWIIARLFGGTGQYLTYAFLLSLFYVPLTAASSVLGLIPFLGGLIAFVIGIYSIYLAILATASAHRLDMGRATWVVLIPLVVAIVLSVILAALAGLALFAMYGLSR